MAANAVDGQLARRAGPTSHGAVLNEVCDVAGDAGERPEPGVGAPIYRSIRSTVADRSEK